MQKMLTAVLAGGIFAACGACTTTRPGWVCFKAKAFAGAVEGKTGCAHCAAWLELGSTGKSRSIVDNVMPEPGRGFLARGRHIFDRKKVLFFSGDPAGWTGAQARRSILCAAWPG